MKSGIIAIVAGLTMIMASIAFSQVPGVINYQGRLTDPNGAPVADSSTNNLTFSIYDSTNAVTPLWAEAHPNVPVMNGLFSVLLGSVTNPLSPSLFSTNAGITRWLEVNVNGETLAPRKELVSVAYAFQAGNAATLEGFPASQFAASSLTNDIIALQSSTNFLLSQTIILQGATNVLQAQATDLQTATGALNAAVGNLNVATGALNIAVGDLQTATNALDIQVGNLQDATNALNLATNSLQAQLGVLATSAVTQAQDPMIISNGVVYLDYDTNDFILAGAIQVRDLYVNSAGDVMMGDLQMFGGTVIQGVDIIDSVAIEDLTIANADIAANANIAASKIDVASIDHGQLAGLADDDHAQYLTPAEHTAINHDHGALGGLGDDDHGQYHNDTRGDARYAGNGWDGTTTLRTAQEHIANDGNMGEEAPLPVAGDRGEPTRAEIEAWGDVNDWDNDDHALVNHATLETDPQVGANTLNRVPRWDSDELVTGRIIDPDTGNIGIGAADPQEELHIASGRPGVRLEDTTTGEKDYEIIVNGNNFAIDEVGVASRLTIDANGKVGIGTTSPGAKLHVVGSTRTDRMMFGVDDTAGVGGDYYSIYREAGAWTYPYPDLVIQYHTGIKYDAHSSYGGHRFYTGYDGSGNPAGLKLSIDDNVIVHSGNVGLGTATPGDKLEINGNLRFTGANPYISASSYFIAPGGAYFNSGTVYTEAALQARGGIHNDVAPHLTISGGYSGYTYFSGNVGVGTPTPAAKLDVRGNVSIRGSIGTSLQTSTYLGKEHVDIGPMFSSLGLLTVYGNAQINGDISATGTKYMRIIHPVNTNKFLYHASIESPLAELLYRGKTQLSNGVAYVNLNTNYGLIPQTLDPILTNLTVCVYNNASWTRVRCPLVSGVSFSIEAETTNCNDIVEWIAVGKRIGINVSDKIEVDNEEGQ